MIVSTMSLLEIDDAYRREIQISEDRIDEAAKRFGSMVKKTTHYPFERVLITKTKNRMELKLIFLATKRGDWNHPRLCIYSSFHYKDGLYAISYGGNEHASNIFTPHFFDRYQERIVKNPSIGREDLIKRYMIQNRDLMWYKNSVAFSTAYQKYEHDNTPQYAARVEEGNCFIEKIRDNAYLMKTILSDDMLGEDQAEAFTAIEIMRRHFALKKKSVKK